jgi:hypothetical protein
VGISFKICRARNGGVYGASGIRWENYLFAIVDLGPPETLSDVIVDVGLA